MANHRVDFGLVKIVKKSWRLLIAVCALSFNLVSCNAGGSSTETSVLQCEPRWYGTPSEDSRCYAAQMKLSGAARRGDLPAIEQALSEGANVNGGAYQSLSALTSAAANGHEDAALLLIRSGADVNRVEGIGNTALKSAVSYGKLSVVKILIENGADVCERTESSALQYAIEKGDSEIISFLVNAGAKDCR